MIEPSLPIAASQLLPERYLEAGRSRLTDTEPGGTVNTKFFKGRAALAAVCGAVLVATVGMAQAQADPVPGGWTTADPNSPTAQEVTHWAATQLNEMSNSAYVNTVTRRVEFQSQVVAGIVYRTEFVWARTNCLKNSGTPEEECSVIPGGPQELCTAKVYDRPWEGSRELTEFECNRIGD